MSDRMTLFLPNLFLRSRKPALSQLKEWRCSHAVIECVSLSGHTGWDDLPQEFGEPHPELTQTTCSTRRETDQSSEEAAGVTSEQRLIITTAGSHRD